MSIEARTETRAHAVEVDHPDTSVAQWLFFVAILVIFTVFVGGATRLTNSGLSITEWQPIMGILPPIGIEAWEDAFNKYKLTYEYRFVNKGMTFGDFQRIFAWEWSHRFVARMIFLTVLIPFIWFWLQDRISRALAPKVWIILGLILLQGLVGWLMVESGLATDVKVSPYRLALHLGLAAVLFCLILGASFSQAEYEAPSGRVSDQSRFAARYLFGLVFVTLIFGAFVAGHRAGRMHDSWPLMEGQLIPSNLFPLTPWFLSFFEDPLTVQFFHRLLAYVLVMSVIVHLIRVKSRNEPAEVQRGAIFLAIAVVAQLVLGIITVLLTVPMALGLAHQFTAFVLLGLTVRHLFHIERHVEAPELRSAAVSSGQIATAGAQYEARFAEESESARLQRLRQKGADAALRAEAAARRFMDRGRDRLRRDRE